MRSLSVDECSPKALNMKGTYNLSAKASFLCSESISETDINLVNLSLILEAACVEHRIEEEERIYVTEDGIFPLWIRIFEKAHFLALSTYITAPEDKTDMELMTFCNEVNQSYLVPSVYVKEQKIWCFQPVYIKEELKKSHFLRLVRYFGDGARKVKIELKDLH